MNKIIAVVVALVVGTGAFLLLGGDDKNETTTQVENVSTVTEQKSSQPAVSYNENSQAGYIDYSEEALIEAADTSRVVFFHAEWCSVCNFYEGQIEKTGVPADITILKVDYDNDTELKKKYGVSVQSTFVLLDVNGEVARTWPFAAGLSGIQDLYDAVI